MQKQIIHTEVRKTSVKRGKLSNRFRNPKSHDNNGKYEEQCNLVTSKKTKTAVKKSGLGNRYLIRKFFKLLKTTRKTARLTDIFLEDNNGHFSIISKR